MTNQPVSPTTRREFFTGKTVRADVDRDAETVVDELAIEQEETVEPTAGDTIRLETRAMACDFAVIMNPGPAEQVEAASNALELVHQLEDQMSVYREHSELSRLNKQAADAPVRVERRLFELLAESRRLCDQTKGGFDPTAGPLVELWSRCRQDGRIPTECEIAAASKLTGIDHVRFDEDQSTVGFDRRGVELNLGGIGKGYALDRAGQLMVEQNVGDWLIHGGHSSLLARGDHNGLGGWPVGIRNPLFPGERLATVLLKDRALSSSGSGVQSFRHAGKRYGHILDPRTGWPVEGMLSVTVLAPTATQADALSTAFFVIGLEKAQRYCDNRDGVSALLIPPPHQGRKLDPVVCGISDEVLFFAEND